MQTLHIQQNQKKDFLHTFLPFLPIIIFGLVIFTYLLISVSSKNEKIATESNPNLGASENNSWVLGDQDNLDNAKYKLIK